VQYVVDLRDLNRHATDRVGGKNANLGELLNSGIRVPPGFALTVDAYLRHLERGGLYDTIRGMLGRLHPDDVTSLDEVGAEIRGLIMQREMPGDISSELRSCYRALEGMCGRDDVPVAVRSSATAEDLPSASFAGQQDTYLWVRGEDGVIEHVKRCWASLFNARAISYRMANDFPHEKVNMSVTVQKMVNSKSAGVMFTLDPQNGDVSQVLIEGNWGLGESVACGEVTPDQFKVDKISCEINSRTISHKHMECVPDPDGGIAALMPVGEDRQRKPCITDEELRELVRIGRLIEQHYGIAQDIEWAIDQDLPFPENVFIVQARPETVWSQKKPEPLLAGKSASELLLQRALQTIKFR
jgi:pyruvate,water dikinase